MNIDRRQVAAIAVFSVLAYLYVIAVFYFELVGHPVSYPSYAMSATALVLDIIFLAPGIVRGIKRIVTSSDIGRRFMTEVSFRTSVLLILSLLINTLYGLVNIAIGLLEVSPWMISFGAYYILTAIIRASLYRSLYRHGFGVHMHEEYSKFRIVGMILMILDVPLAGIVILMMAEDSTPVYGEILVISFASYAFYSLSLCIVNLVRYRRFRSPLLSAVKRIDLVHSLVTMLNMQTAMLAVYNTDDSFHDLMVALLGVSIIIFILLMSIDMIRRGNRGLEQSKEIL